MGDPQKKCFKKKSGSVEFFARSVASYVSTVSTHQVGDSTHLHQKTTLRLYGNGYALQTRKVIRFYDLSRDFDLTTLIDSNEKGFYSITLADIFKL